MDLRAVEVCTFEFLAASEILMVHAAKSRDGLYEPVLAESEREAVADLLQYLENVRAALSALISTFTDIFTAGRNRLFFWRTLTSLEHPGVLR